MSFTVADIPTLMPDTFDVVFERMRHIEPARAALSQEQIAALKLSADEAAAQACQILDGLLDFEVEWKTSVFEGETEYDQAIQDRLDVVVKIWAEGVEAFLSSLDRLKPMGLHLAGLDALRSQLAEVRSMLTPDDEFFRGEELDEMARAAIEEDEAGRTVAFEVMGE
jgi:hypothetical protein